MSRFVTVQAVADELGCTPEHVRNLLGRGELEGVNLKGRSGWRITRDSYDAFLARNGAPAPKPTYRKKARAR